MIDTSKRLSALTLGTSKAEVAAFQLAQRNEPLSKISSTSFQGLSLFGR